MRDVGGDGDADGRHAVLERVPEPCRVAAPVLQHLGRRLVAHEADGALPVRREQPVVGGRRAHGAHLHRLLAPEDGIGAEATLTLEAHTAVVEGAQQAHQAPDLEEVLVGQPLDVPAGADDAAHLRFVEHLIILTGCAT